MKRLITIGCLIVGVAILVFAGNRLFQDPNSQLPSSLQTPQPSTESNVVRSVSSEAATGPEANVHRSTAPSSETVQTAKEMDKGLDILAQTMKEKYGDTLFHPQFRVNMLEKLLAFFQKRYPDDWRKRLDAFLKATFPEFADQLLATADQLLAYHDWLAENKAQLMKMSREDRRNLLWQRRQEFFGDDATVIWEAEWKAESVYRALDDVASGQVDGFDEKVGYYTEALFQAYRSEAPRMMEKRGQELMDAFLDLETVQQDLHQMDEEDRKAALRKFRSAMGVGDEAISRLEQLDAIRDERWQRGTAYMKQRQQLMDQYEGEELEQQLDALRETYFGSQAATIKGEEQSGFFRFNRPRVYGKN